MNVVDPTPEWISPKQLAAELGIAVATIYNWRHQGEGPRGYKIGKHVRFRRSDVEAWLDRQIEPGTAA